MNFNKIVLTLAAALMLAACESQTLPVAQFDDHLLNVQHTPKYTIASGERGIYCFAGSYTCVTGLKLEAGEALVADETSGAPAFRMCRFRIMDALRDAGYFRFDYPEVQAAIQKQEEEISTLRGKHG